MRRAPIFLLPATVLLLASLPLAAQKFLPKTIQFKGAPEYSDQELLAAAGLKWGTVLDFSEMKDHSQKLMDTGVFETVSFKFDGVDLFYTLASSPTMYPVRLENLPLAPGKELGGKLHDRLPLYHGLVPSEGGLLEGVRATLEEMLAALGIKASVVAMPHSDAGLHKVIAMSFAISAPQVRVGAIHLGGVSAGLEAGVKRAADHETGELFDTENSAKNLEHALELFYADEGYAAANAHAAPSGGPLVKGDAIDVPFLVTVEEGRLYKLGSVHLPPNALLTQAEVNKAFGLHTGLAKGVTLRTTWFMIASKYKSLGYLDCKVTPHPEFDDATDTVNYTVDVDPGPVYHLAFVKFDNVSEQLRSRLMRAWQVLPGDPFDESYVSNFITSAEKGDPVLMRSLVGVKVSFEVLADSQTHEVNCVIHLAKAQQGP